LNQRRFHRHWLDLHQQFLHEYPHSQCEQTDQHARRQNPDK
jgi:hypothetical protein